MRKKIAQNETIHFYKKFEFYLSPVEFLSMVWVYRKEISPELEMLNHGEQKKPLQIEDFLHSVRFGILNGDLKAVEFNTAEWRYFVDHSRSLFAIFRNAIDQNIKKPDSAQIGSARNSFADLLHLDDRGNLPHMESDLVEGNITFSLSFNTDNAKTQ